ncbi:MAG TPA: HlyD family efflux transporter periplasmic adaptor subunit [Candidatus Paceibacterota bacterium]|nr:HlyD family efflux transporter periplasmic adaptor subunit [Candidatus Paceibacterota bacterium]
MGFLRRVFARVHSWAWYWQVALGVGVVIVIAAGAHASLRSDATAPAVSQVPHVREASVASLSSQNVGPLPVVGTVTSLDHATLLAQSSGPVTSLVRQLGSYVPAGGIIGELENSAQRAAVLQAQGAYDAAQAAFANTSGTNAQNSGIGANQAVQNAANAQVAVNAALQSVYSALDDAVHTKADLLFTNPRTNPAIILTLTDSQLGITLQNQRTALEHTLALANTKANATARTDADADIVVMAGYGQSAVAFLNNLVEAVNKAIPTQDVSASEISASQTSIGSARSEVVSALSSLATAKTSYDNAVASAATASNTAGQGTTNSISAAQAQVTQAQGALDAARSALEKTIIRSPISGTIVSLPITRGGYIMAGTQVAVVSNPSALQVEAYVTPSDAKTIAVGGAAVIGQGTKGVIVSIAPALDPTIGKILIKIGIPGSQASLTDGDTLSVMLTRANPAQVKKTDAPAGAILIPIVAAKITPQGPVVFQVTASSTLQSIPVTLGTILGEQVTVSSGLAPEMVIVDDARGLSDGETVVVDSQ